MPLQTSPFQQELGPMSKRNSDNLRIKRKYLVWMKDARGYS